MNVKNTSAKVLAFGELILLPGETGYVDNVDMEVVESMATEGLVEIHEEKAKPAAKATKAKAKAAEKLVGETADGTVTNGPATECPDE